MIICNKIKKGNPLFGKINLRLDESKKIFPITKKAKKILDWNKKVPIKKAFLIQLNFIKEDLQK